MVMAQRMILYFSLIQKMSIQSPLRKQLQSVIAPQVLERMALFASSNVMANGLWITEIPMDHWLKCVAMEFV